MAKTIIFSTENMEVKIERFLKGLRNMLLVFLTLCVLIVFKRSKVHFADVAATIPDSASKYLYFEKASNNSHRNIFQLRTLVNHHNTEGIIINTDYFGPIGKDIIVFVITVNGLTIYLKFLIVSLSQVRGIDKVLLIFSHRIFDEDANKLIRSIDFCRVLQIYYPYSIKMYPDEFPGYSPQDCPHDMNSKTARSLNCTGSHFPDIRGHFRNPYEAEEKHHWWWTANVVFEKVLSIVIDYEGKVIFIKEDVYVLKDFLYMVLYMNRISLDLDNFELMTLEGMPYIKHLYGLDILLWNINYEPRVLAFGVYVWNSIVSNYDLFCTVDDSSWARSLLHISMKRKHGLKYRILSSMFPRAYKTSACGVGHVSLKCDILESVYQILEAQRIHNESLFPANLEVFTHIEDENDPLNFDYSESYGGWSDPRDISMCKNLTMSKIKKIVMEMEDEFIKFES